MKKLLFISVLSVLTLTSCVCTKFADAQDDSALRWHQGDITATASGNFDISKQGDEKDNYFEISPSVGYFFTDRLEAGLGVSYSAEKNEFGSSEDKQNSFSVGPYLRYYYCPQWRLMPFFEANVNYTSINYDTADFKQNGLDASVGLGVSYKINDRLGLMARYTGLQYQSLSDDRDGFDNRSSFSGGFDTRNIMFGGIVKF